MNSRCMALVVLSIATVVSPAIAQGPVGTAFTYQGSLNENDVSADGDYDFQFRLYDAPAAGAQIGVAVNIDTWPVVGGLFTVLLDFDEAAFGGDARWLEIDVRQTGGGGFVTLAPRQELTPTPYARFSSLPWQTSGNDVFFDGARVGVGTNNPLFRLDVRSPTPRAIFGWVTNPNGNTYGVYGQSESDSGTGIAGIATADTGITNGVLGSSDSATGRGVFGLATSNDRAANASGVHGESQAVFGAGVVGRATHPSGVTYGVRGSVDSPNGWAGFFTGRSYFSESVGIGVALLDGPLVPLHVVQNGVQLGAAALGGEDLVIEDIDAKLGLYSTDSGVGGSGLSLGQVDSTFGNLLDKWSLIRETRSGGNGLRFTFGPDPSAFSNATVAYFDDNGNIGFGTTTPLSAVHVQGTNIVLPEAALSNDDVVIEDSDAVLGLYSNSGGNWASAVVLGRLNPNGGLVDKWGMAQRVGGDLQFTYGTDPNYASNTKILSMLPSGDVGIGIADPDVRLHAIGGSDAELNGGGYLQLGRSSLLNVVFDNNEIMARNNGAAATLFLNNDGGDVVIAPQGTARVRILEITGADLAEKFPTSEPTEPGTVMEIDPENPGELRVSRGEYNRRVAGVVSGAGDIPVGAILGNLPGSEAAPAIALSGRVWVKCDATHHAIEIGDLLTTSATPGYAMAALDFGRSHGTVIGKAMTALPRHEKGLVLVLVNLH